MDELGTRNERLVISRARALELMAAGGADGPNRPTSRRSVERTAAATTASGGSGAGGGGGGSGNERGSVGGGGCWRGTWSPRRPRTALQASNPSALHLS